MYELRHYVSPEGEDLFARWLDHLRDRQAQTRVAVRLIRLENGNFGDKRTQSADIERAIDRWNEWQRRSKK